MHRPSRCAVLAASLVALLAIKAGAAEIDLNGKRFTLADGLTLEVAAAAPLTERPICVDFDEQGRLYVAESSGTNDNVQKQLADKPHSILRLEDTDGDGVFDRRTVFADRMMFPEGCAWHDGSLYVGAPPQIWKLTDTNDDGVADRREVWFDGKTLTGCANDLHGPYAGPDGLLYWCKGAFAEQTHERPNGAPFVTRAAHIFRHDPRDGFVEPILTGGMDNPVEVAFTRDGEPILSCTFFQRPAGGHRDGLIHAVYGGVWGKDHGVLDGHPRTGDLMPPLVHLGAAAPCGLLRVESSELRVESSKGREDELPLPLNSEPSTLNSPDTLLACSFNLHKVSRHVLRPAGATFATTDDDLLVCDDVDFHPTDVIEDADGSLLVIDTGGWYKLCCPTSQLHKPDVPGAIYRVRRADGPRRDDPRGLKLDWDEATPAELASRFVDDRFAVRRRAVAELAALGPNALPTLTRVLSDGNADERRLAVWTLTRIDHSDARAAVRSMFDDGEPSVLRTAVRSAGLWRDAESLDLLRPLLRADDPHTRRVAAESLARLADPAAVPDLLAAAAAADDDRFLHHAVTYALIAIADPSRTRAGLAADAPGTVRAALLALAQMPDGKLDPDELFARIDSPALRDTALFLLERRPEWDAAVAGFLDERLRQPSLAQQQQNDLRHLAVRFSSRPAVRALLADHAVQGATVESRAIALRAMASAGVKTLPAAWTDALAAVIQSGDAVLMPLAVEAAASAEKLGGDADRLRDALRAVASAEHAEPDDRLRALRIVAPDAPLDLGAFEFLRHTLAKSDSVSRRLLAADVLASADLAPAQARQLAELAADLGPMELDRLLPAFAKRSDEETGLTLARALADSSAAGDVAPEKLRAAFAKFGPAVIDAARPVLERPQADADARRTRLDELLGSVTAGDSRRGQAVFQSSKAACVSCHAIGHLGGRVGPDLTRIGDIRAERDLLEAILFPSASFVRSYEPVVVVTTDGLVHSGVPREEADDALLLQTAADKTVSIPHDEIDEMRPGTISIMPAGLEKQLTAQEFADLVAFLKIAR